MIIMELPCATMFDHIVTRRPVSLNPSSSPVLFKLELDGIPLTSQRIFTCCDLAVDLLDPQGGVGDRLNIVDSK